MKEALIWIVGGMVAAILVVVTVLAANDCSEKGGTLVKGFAGQPVCMKTL